MNWLLRTPWRSEYRTIQVWHYSSILSHLQPPSNYPPKKKDASNVIGRVHWHTYQWSWYRSMEERPRRDSESRSATTTLLLENLHGNAANLVATTALPLPPLRSRSRIALSAQSYVKFCNMNLWSSCSSFVNSSFETPHSNMVWLVTDDSCLKPDGR